MEVLKIPICQVDAFTDHAFAGNPAAVCVLDDWLATRTMQAIANENNLSETAFIVERNDGDFDLRWFTPTVEVELCGHATLAAGAVLLTEPGSVTFHTLSGRLGVERKPDGRLFLDLPVLGAGAEVEDPGILAALSAPPLSLRFVREETRGRFLLAEYPNAKTVAGLSVPDIESVNLMVTAPGDDCDFVSRYFAPASGIPEDPVTGSMHATLAPLWAERLGVSDLTARQLSPRGGHLWCHWNGGDRVAVGGHAVVVLEGSLLVPSPE